jgi:predicted esterase
MLRTQIFQAHDRPCAVCIILHGLGDSHLGMAGLAVELHLEDFTFMLPDAPDAYDIGYSWYTIPREFFTSRVALNREELVESCRDEVERSRRLVHELLDTAVDRYPDTPLILGGFSQGGLIALDAGFQYPRPLAALFALSSYFPQAEEILPDSPQSRDTPVFIGHGTADDVVMYDYGVQSAEGIRSQGWQVEFLRDEGLGHGISPDELEKLRSFLSRSVP